MILLEQLVLRSKDRKVEFVIPVLALLEGGGGREGQHC